MLKGFDNVSLSIKEMDRSVRFYRDVLGMMVHDTYGDTMTFMAIEGAETTIMLQQRENPGVGNGLDLYDPDGNFICLIDYTGMKQ